MTPEEVLDRLRLAHTEGIGPIAWRRLVGRYGSAAAALDALPALARAGGRSRAPRIPPLSAAREEVERLARLGGQLLVLGGPDYPPLLALLADAPPILAVLGDPAVLPERAVAIVGGRNASANGQRIAEELALALATQGLSIVSGMARGIDAAAHRGALASGRTIAAVAGGLDVPYPPQHRDLQAAIAKQGAVISEAPLGTAPQARHFPRRNRIIAGLVLGVVVIEAAPLSGSLITARLALECGRELYAVPGSPLDPRTRGSNDLIRQGAHLVETAADVVEHLPASAAAGEAAWPFRVSGPNPSANMPLPSTNAPPEVLQEPGKVSDPRAQILELLDSSPTTVDDLVRRCHFSAAAVNAVLLELEVAGRVELLPGDRVIVRPDARG
ncbi:MAG: DNA-processing protein DprA [Acetobacteraceae bacterium]